MLSMLGAGRQGPAWRVIESDFPDASVPDYVGHDGQLFYALARDPLNLDAVAPDLDRPRYRSQRILLPLLAGTLHPGIGYGLIISLFLVSAAGVFAGAIASGVLAAERGGSPLVALLFPLLPGTLVSLRLSDADGLACGLAIAAVACLGRSAFPAAVALGVGAALAKEWVLLILLAPVIVERSRRALIVFGVPALVTMAWWLSLRVLLESGGESSREFSVGGLLDAARFWSQRGSIAAPVVVTGAVILGGVALLRSDRMTDVLGAAAGIQLFALLLLGSPVFEWSWDAARVTLPLYACAVPLLASSARGRSDGLTRPRGAPVSTR